MASSSGSSRLKSGVLVIMGSGETSPTMVTLHQQLLAPYGPDPHAVVVDTPAGFQENVTELTDKAIAYFRDSVGVGTQPLNYRSTADAVSDPVAHARAMTTLQSANWVFAGPGSPTYALRTWDGSAVPEALRSVLAQGGTVVMASAASLTLGSHTVPVYEIYKVGEEPRWLPGLDLVGSATGWTAAVVPHFDNNDGGGTHDTRYCYLGQRRLTAMESQLPDGAVVLGVDEHTAFVLDLATDQVRVVGRGGVTLRVNGQQRQWPAGATVAFAELDAFVAGAQGRALEVQAANDAGAMATGSPAVLDDALDLAGTLAVIIELDRRATSDEERAHVRALLAKVASRAAPSVDIRATVAPFVESLLDLRVQARSDKRWDDADRVRDALTACGVEVRDTPDGAEWSLA